MKVNVHAIQAFLESQKMSCVSIPKSQELPFDQILLPLGVDEQGRDLVLGIKFIEEELSSTQELFSLEKGMSKFFNIQFNYLLPFTIKDEYVGEVARLILLLNHSFGLPGFELSEIDHAIYFRNVLLVGEEIEEMMVMMVIGNILANVDAFSSSIEAVATGKMSLTDVINAAQAETP